jgi:hypothetical protein
MIKFRCSSLGRLMTDPKTKAEGVLSVGAKTYIRELAAESIFGVSFNVSSRAMEKGILMEPEAIGLLNRVRCLTLEKNTERKTNDWITGECDAYDPIKRHGYDTKCSWSVSTFPISSKDAEDKGYWWQMQGYMMLWGADTWEVDYVLLDTPEHLIGYEAKELHIVSHIPEHHRLTSWHIERDESAQAKIVEKCQAAQEYFKQVLAEFDATHVQHQPEF